MPFQHLVRHTGLGPVFIFWLLRVIDKGQLSAKILPSHRKNENANNLMRNSITVAEEYYNFPIISISNFSSDKTSLLIYGCSLIQQLGSKSRPKTLRRHFFRRKISKNAAKWSNSGNSKCLENKKWKNMIKCGKHNIMVTYRYIAHPPLLLSPLRALAV